MEIKKPTRKLISAAIVSMIAASAAHAGAFSLYGEGNGFNAGNYAAGSAAEAADASTGWYNPAGLALIHSKQSVAAGTGVFPNSKFNGTVTYTETGVPTYTEQVYDMEVSKSGFVPAGHIAIPIGEGATFGLSMVAPFGLATDAGGSATRYSAAYTKLVTVNISPEIGGMVYDNVAVGAGIDIQHAHVNFGRILGDPIAGLLSPFANPTALDGRSVNKGNSLGFGFHAGVLVMLNDNHTRIGLNHQSEVKHKFHGDSVLTAPLLVTNGFAGYTHNLTSNNIRFPSVTTLSAYHDVNDKLALLGSVVYTTWNVFKNIELINVAGPNGGGPVDLRLISTSTQNYHNAWRGSLGANYKINDKLMMRIGGGYDETPTNDLDRDIRLPDASRWAFAIGAHYQASHALGVDVGYTRLWMGAGGSVNKSEDALPLANPAGTATLTIVGDTKAHADLVGIQATYTLDEPVATK